MDDLTALIEERNKVWEIQKEINDKAVDEKRNLTPEEEEQWEKADKDFQDLTDKIEESRKAKEKETARQNAFDAKRDMMSKSQNEPIKPDPKIEPTEKRKRVPLRDSEEYRKAYSDYLRTGEIKGILDEARALQKDSDPAGGYLVTPTQFMNDIIKDLDDEFFVRRYARKLALPTAMAIEVPARKARMSGPTNVSELTTGGLDTTLEYEARRLTPHPFARTIKVSKSLLRVANFPIEAEVRSEFVYEFGQWEEDKFLQGTGGSEPLGIFTAHAAGISTGQDVSTGNTTTEIKADGLIECVYSLKAQYRRNARWIFHRDALKMIRKLKTGDGDYIWNAGIASNRPATILDIPYDESEYVPNTFNSGLYVGALCDYNFYWIADALDMQIQVLTELYAATNQNGYLARKETDAMPVREDGFARVTLA